MADKGDVDILALEQLVRTPFRSGGIKVVDADGKPEFLPGPERIPKTRGRNEIYLNNKNIGDMGAKLIGNELKNNTDCISLWIYGNGITLEGATEIAKGLKVNTTLEVLDLHDNSIGNEGAKVLAQALKQNRTLKRLNICSNGIGPKLPQVLQTPRRAPAPAPACAPHTRAHRGLAGRLIVAANRRCQSIPRSRCSASRSSLRGPSLHTTLGPLRTRRCNQRNPSSKRSSVSPRQPISRLVPLLRHKSRLAVL